jgi:hypothetical protein
MRRSAYLLALAGISAWSAAAVARADQGATSDERKSSPDAPPAESSVEALAPVELLPQEAAPSRHPLSLYGFFDFGFNKFYTSDNSQLGDLFPTRAGTFVLGNINLFVDAQPWESWRTLLEIRFTNLPHGVERGFASPAGDSYERTDTQVEDFTSSSIRGSVTLGSIIIERAQTEYVIADTAKLMGGYFFTPFGIWNEDHGTPTLISLLLPSFIADQTIPVRVLGAQFSGSAYIGSWEVGYQAWLGNSRTPSQVDFDEDKSFGGRVFANSSGSALKTKLGASGYYGTGSDVQKTVVSVDPFRVETSETRAFDEWALGLDASLDAGPLRIRTEALVHDRQDALEGSPDAGSSSQTYNGYALASYRLPWAGIEPYLYVEGIRWQESVGDTILIPSAGINVHFNPAVQLKTQYARAMFFDLDDETVEAAPSANNIHNIAARLVVSF